MFSLEVHVSARRYVLCCPIFVGILRDNFLKFKFKYSIEYIFISNTIEKEPHDGVVESESVEWVVEVEVDLDVVKGLIADVRIVVEWTVRVHVPPL